MYKKKLINLTAITLAMSLAFGSAVTSFAADKDVAIESFLPTPGYGEGEPLGEGDGELGTLVVVGENENVVVEDGEVVTIKGNPVGTGEDTSAIEAGEKSIVFVEGESVTSETVGIDAKSGSVVVVTGTDGNDELRNNVSGEQIGIKSEGDAVVAVHGDVSGGNGIVSDGTGLIVVDGDINGNSAGFVVESSVGKEGGVVIVTGDIGADVPMSDPSKIILISGSDHYTDYSSAGKTEDGYDYAKIAQAIIDSFPEYYAYSYNGLSIRQNYSLKESGLSYDTMYHSYLSGHYDDKVNYIIKPDEATKDLYQITGGYNEQMLSEYGLYTLSAKASLTVAAQAGYTITGGESVNVIDNGDNTYTVKIKSWHGNINIRAVLKPTSTTVAVDNNNNYRVTSQPTEEEEVVEVPYIFASFSILDNGDLPEVLGASLEDGVVSSRPVVKVKADRLTATQYKRTFIDTVKNAPANAVIRIETSASYCIDKMMMEALAARPDVSLEVTFPVNHDETVTVTVPAGYDVMSLLDENGYCGFLYLNSVFNA